MTSSQRVGGEGADAILGSWIALEALEPQTYRRPEDLAQGDKQRVFPLRDGLPWDRKPISGTDDNFYFQVVLGTIPVGQATDALAKVFGASDEARSRATEKAAIAVALVDRHGVLLDGNESVAISSFAWALPIALRDEMRRLGNWPDAERELVEALRMRLQRRDEDGKPAPLDSDSLQKTFAWLREMLGLEAGLYEEPSFLLRVPSKGKSAPEAPLLNSFFLEDLARARSLLWTTDTPPAWARYLGMEQVTPSQDLLSDPAELERLLAPAKMPRARWPAPGGHPLVTLQQAAVNAVRSELGAGQEGIVAVNGPPGTGKTTLLRDVVAACVLDRACAMATFDDPNAAFRATGQKEKAGNGFFMLYSLDEQLKGHEVLVASSNNKAVENISKELPSLEAVRNGEISYFRSVSNRLASTKEEIEQNLCVERTWGLVAAVLGNADNRKEFWNAIWWDRQRSLRLHLKAAQGKLESAATGGAANAGVSPAVQPVVDETGPDNPGMAVLRWKQAREAFLLLKGEVEREMDELEAIRQDCLELPRERASKHEAARAFDEANAKLRQVARALESAQVEADQAKAKAERAKTLEQSALAERPGWWMLLFGFGAFFKKWVVMYAPLKERRNHCVQEALRAIAAVEEAQASERKAAAAVTFAEAELAKLSAAVADIERRLNGARKALGDRIVDDIFFERGPNAWNLSAPWVSDSLHAKREALFAAAMGVHRAFIDVVARQVSHNLGALMSAMQGGGFGDDRKRALLGDLWSTLFLVIPVLSTTFASVGRMLADLPSSSLGWLLIDEAGQATPQAAVGAVMRAKRVIVVGDPLQIEPVVTLPKRLTNFVAKRFGIDADRWLAPHASAQTLADSACRYQAEFSAEVGVRRVGLPLLVHRRCQEPMFSVSNRIAYDGQMVHAVSRAGSSPLVEALGASAWLDVVGAADRHWCPAEGEVVLRLLERVADAGLTAPDLYVIAPFRNVAEEMRALFRHKRPLLAGLGLVTKEAGDDWLKTRIGTIHTFQGKEAEVVIAVLGAPSDEKLGARQWAAGTPNIINVMVTRAKHALYVVGSHAAWSAVGHATELARALPRKDAATYFGAAARGTPSETAIFSQRARSQEPPF